eukprot:6489919-Amphidinium_carterae.2
MSTVRALLHPSRLQEGSAWTTQVANVAQPNPPHTTFVIVLGVCRRSSRPGSLNRVASFG